MTHLIAAETATTFATQNHLVAGQASRDSFENVDASFEVNGFQYEEEIPSVSNEV